VVFFIGPLGDVVFSLGVGTIGPGFTVMLADAVELFSVDAAGVALAA